MVWKGLSRRCCCRFSSIVDLFELKGLSADAVSQAFDWITDHGDLISQVGAVEFGLRVLAEFPRIEPSLATITGRIAADNPTNLMDVCTSCRAWSRSSKGSWANAHCASTASVLKTVGRHRSRLADRARGDRRQVGISEPGRLGDHERRPAVLTQTLIDLRLEPRWLPDFISAQQLKAELVGRIATVAERHRRTLRVLSWRQFCSERIRRQSSPDASSLTRSCPALLRAGSRRF